MARSFCFITLVIVLLSCNTSRKVASNNLSGNWELTVFPSGDKTFTELFGERKPELQFDVVHKKVTGSTGCNRLSTTYTAHDTIFSFGPNIITTKMACAGYEESNFLDALTKVNHYTIAGNQLRLMQDATLVMAFEKKEYDFSLLKIIIQRFNII